MCQDSLILTQPIYGTDQSCRPVYSILSKRKKKKISINQIDMNYEKPNK